MIENILITGGVGFIGVNLADYFLEKGHNVVIFDNFLRKKCERNLIYLLNKYPDLDIEGGDVRHLNDMLDIIKRKDIDTIFHTAGQTAVTTSVINPEKDFEINALGTFNVLESARKSGNEPIIIFTSTNKVYGNDVNKIPIREKETRYEFADERHKNGIPENFPTDANEHSPYGCSKYAADIYVRDYAHIYGIKTVVFRMSCIYGIRQFGTEDQGWLAHFVISSVLKRPLTIYGNGKQVRDVLFIDDLVKLFENTTKHINKTKGNVYNIGGGSSNTLSLLELLEILKNKDLSTKISYSDWRPGDQKVYISNIGKIKETGWEPKVSPEEGTQRLIEWVQNNKKIFK